MLDENNLKHILEESTCERDLGVLIDNRLRWQPQINIAKSKAYASLGSLKRAIKHWTPSIFKVLYTAFVRPHLEFCSSVWCPTNQSDVASIELVQKHATKVIPSLRSLHYEDRLLALGLTTLEIRRVRGDLIQFFKFFKGINEISWVKPYLPTPSSLQSGPAGSVRGNHDRLNWQASKTKVRENFFLNRTIPIWNRLPSEVTSAHTVNSFKNRIDNIDLKTIIN